MNSFGRLFRVSIYGESHGPSVGVVIDGCPPGLPLSPADLAEHLGRRRSGRRGTTGRKEPDEPIICSGVFRGTTTGSPVCIGFRNADARPEDYGTTETVPRPGHADLTARQKFRGYNDPRGGGHFSGRLTVGLVAAGAVARKLILPAEVRAEIAEAGGSADIEGAVGEAVESGDSVGGIISCTASPMPTGLGEPFFDSAESLISHLVFSIPGVRGIEFGSGFEAASMRGSQHNDCIIDRTGATATNNAGGVNGGITSGNDLSLKVCIKPTPSVHSMQRTLNLGTGEMEELRISGRHDACVALRCPVIVESAVAIALADLSLCGKALDGHAGQAPAEPGKHEAEPAQA